MNTAEQRERVYPIATQTMEMVLASGERVRYYEDTYFSEVTLATGDSVLNFFVEDEDPKNRHYEKRGIIFPHGGRGIITGIQIALMNPTRGPVDYSTPATAEAVDTLGKNMMVMTKVADRQFTNDFIEAFLPTVFPTTGALQFNPNSPANHDQIKRFPKGGFEVNQDLKFEAQTKTFCGYTVPAALNGYHLRYKIFGRTFIPK